MWATNQIDGHDIESYVRDARDYALTHGLVLRYSQMTNDNCVGHIPFTLFPSPFPERLYRESLDVQPIISSLMLKIANDHVFMENSLSGVAKVDSFTRSLLDINKTILKEGRAQSVSSCITRSDYMLDRYVEDDKESLRIRQVEVNAIASGMAFQSRSTKLMHDFLMSKYRIKPCEGVTFPKNESLETIAGGLIDAYNAYGKQDCYILLVAEGRSLNFSDQYNVELLIRELRPDIRLIRRYFAALPDIIKLGPNKELLVEGAKEIGVVYFRYGYDPSNYNFDNAWDTRLLIERSRAIKCPSINFHLSGAKKFQQILNNQQQLEKFLKQDEALKLSRLFCNFWSIEAETISGEEGFRRGLNAPRDLVLKPQREGGGHNIFGQEIKPFLEQLAPEERVQYILMEHIKSPKEKNILLLYDDDPIHDKTRLKSNDELISELGIYGNILADNNSILQNGVGGYLVRSKKFGVNEGGVASGYAGLSSLMLINDTRDDLDRSIYFV